MFEVQFTAWGFGWVVVYLDFIERDELAELTFEAWRLSAPERLISERGTGCRNEASYSLGPITSTPAMLSSTGPLPVPG